MRLPLKRGEAIINDLNVVIKNWNDFANQENVRKDLQEKIRLNLNVLNSILKQSPFTTDNSSFTTIIYNP